MWVLPQRARAGVQRVTQESGSLASWSILLRQRALGEVGERDVLDDVAQVRAHRDPDALQRLGGAGVVTASGRSPRTAASGPSTARITSATVISAAGFAS